MTKKRIAILGSTGSIGINTLKVVDQYPQHFKVVALTAYLSSEALIQQARKYAVKTIAVAKSQVNNLRIRAGFQKFGIYSVEDDLAMLASSPEVDIVVIAMRGSAALVPFLAAVKAGKIVATANKEALVVAGDILMQEAQRNKAVIVPIDSEQSAIFQCLHGQRRDELKRVILTASGGALLRVPASQFNRITVQEILAHPRWNMGPKITVDSATLMNKGFEVIEAQRLFKLKANEIEVVIHPQAIIHSMVEYIDGSTLAQLGVTDMRLPIQYALTYPKRLPTQLPELDFFKLKELTFESPDHRRFPALRLCFQVAAQGGSMPCVLNAADEIAVEAFLNNQIKFTKILDIVSKVVSKHQNISRPSLKQIFAVDAWAREEARILL